MEELKKAIKEKKLTLGSRETLAKMKTGKVKNVYLSKDCKESVKRDVMSYAKIADVKVHQLDINASELGTMCKKQFSVSVLSY